MGDIDPSDWIHWAPGFSEKEKAQFADFQAELLKGMAKAMNLPLYLTLDKEVIGRMNSREPSVN